MKSSLEVECGVFQKEPFGKIGLGRACTEIKRCGLSLSCLAGKRAFKEECETCWSGYFVSYLEEELPDFWHGCLRCLSLIEDCSIDERMFLMGREWAVEEGKKNFLSLLLPSVGFILTKSGIENPVVPEEMISIMGDCQKRAQEDVFRFDKGLNASLCRGFSDLLSTEPFRMKILCLLDIFIKSMEENKKPLKAGSSLTAEIEQFLKSR